MGNVERPRNHDVKSILSKDNIAISLQSDVLGLTNTDAIGDVARGPEHAEPTTERMFDMNNDTDTYAVLSMTDDCWSAEKLIEVVGTMDALDVLENGVITPNATVMLIVGEIMAAMTLSPMSIGAYVYTDESADEPTILGVLSYASVGAHVAEITARADAFPSVFGWASVSAYWLGSGFMMDMDTLLPC